MRRLWPSNRRCFQSRGHYAAQGLPKAQRLRGGNAAFGKHASASLCWTEPVIRQRRLAEIFWSFCDSEQQMMGSNRVKTLSETKAAAQCEKQQRLEPIHHSKTQPFSSSLTNIPVTQSWRVWTTSERFHQSLVRKHPVPISHVSHSELVSW